MTEKASYVLNGIEMVNPNHPTPQEVDRAWKKLGEVAREDADITCVLNAFRLTLDSSSDLKIMALIQVILTMKKSKDNLMIIGLDLMRKQPPPLIRVEKDVYERLVKGDSL